MARRTKGEKASSRVRHRRLPWPLSIAVSFPLAVPVSAAAEGAAAPAGGNEAVLSNWQSRTGQIGQLDEAGRVRWIGR
ncbi:MAG: hypothetical protein N2483_00245 [Burkholderiaceae bacterium]|nr:hypothetical protein [Burkholderiaceae bacterium]